MNYVTNTYKTKGGESIFYYKWNHNPEIPLKGIVQISHGVGEHAGRYQPIASLLQEQGFEVYANDHRVHGRSAASKTMMGFYDGDNYFEDAIEDMHELSLLIKKEHPDKKNYSLRS